MSKRKKVVVLISGRGSNLAALADAAAEKDYPAEIVGVISDKPDAAGVAYARSRGIETRVIERKSYASKEEHDTAIDASLIAFGAEIVALAGYMRLFTPQFVARWSGRLINIHPALLPLFKGLDTHRRALDAGVRLHGCTVHFVTAETDEGPIIAQSAVPVHRGDTEDALAARVLKAEHALYPMALAMLALDKVRMEFGRAMFVDDMAIVEGQGSLQSPAALRDTVDLEALARFTP